MKPIAHYMLAHIIISALACGKKDHHLRVVPCPVCIGLQVRAERRSGKIASGSSDKPFEWHCGTVLLTYDLCLEVADYCCISA